MGKLLLCCALIVGAATSCSGDDASPSSGTGPTTAAPAGTPTAGDPEPPRIPEDFTWTGRYLVPDIDVDVPFTWHGSDGDFQMVAGGEDEVIHFTNLIHDGHLYTLTYEWPDVPRNPCSHVGPYTVEELNDGFADAAHVGLETLHGDPDRLVHHHRAVGVIELPSEMVPGFEGAPVFRLPIMSGDIYVDADDPTVFRKVLHFGVQNLYDPNLDEWIVIDEVSDAPGEITLPDECREAREAGAPADSGG